MLTESKRNMIAPVSVFFLLYISRIVVSLTNAQAVTSGVMKSDVLISIIAAMCLNLILSLPALYCCTKNKNPLDVRGINVLYSLYFVFLAGVNTARFSYFAANVLNPEAPAWVFSVLIMLCVCYAATLGIEGLARFSAFAFILIVITFVVCILFNIDAFNEINLYPVVGNTPLSIVKNIIFIASGSSEISVLLCIKGKVNGSVVKHFVFSAVAAMMTTFIMICFAIGVMGDAAGMEPFPIYTLFQLAKSGLFQRFDVLHISLWIFGMFLKNALLVYCASLSVKGFKNNTKCIAASAAALAFALAVTQLRRVSEMSPIVYAAPYFVFCVLIPLFTLILKKRNSGDVLIERF